MADQDLEGLRTHITDEELLKEIQMTDQEMAEWYAYQDECNRWSFELDEELNKMTDDEKIEMSWAVTGLRENGCCGFEPPIAGFMLRLGLLENSEKLRFVEDALWQIKRGINARRLMSKMRREIR